MLADDHVAENGQITEGYDRPQSENQVALEQSHTNNNAEVCLIVGPNQHKFTVNEDLICEFCPFFRNAFTGNFIEAKTKVLSFPDDDPERFVELLSWLLDGGFPEVNHTWKELSTAWLFADKYHIDKFQNAIVDVMHLEFATREEGINISYETLDFVAENTADNQSSPLRRLFADMLTNGISLQQLPSRLNQIPVEFLQDMVLALKRTVSLNGPTNISLLTNPVSSYYAHPSDSCKSNARRTDPPPINETDSHVYCDGLPCRDKQAPSPIKGNMHICTNHNLKLCQSCQLSHHGPRGHRKKLFTFTTAPYRDAITGDSLVVDGQINDSGFYCDGPKCDPDRKGVAHETWALMNGDRYHCMDCDNIDYCSICVRGDLSCKTAGHSLLRIRPTFAKSVHSWTKRLLDL